jgi:hypothetical protein
MGRVSTETLGRWAYAATIIGVPLLLAALLLAYCQIRDASKAARLTNFITLTNEFFNPTNTAIISTIEDGKPILIENKGRYTDAQLDNYLGEFDTIDTAYTEGLLSEEHLCISFSYYADITNKNKEITAYIKSQRRTQGRNSSPFFLGFSKVVKVVAESGLPDCH